MAISVKDADNNTQTINTLPALSQASSANSLPVVLSTEQQTILSNILAKIIAAPATEAKQDDLISAVQGISSDATAANQVTANTSLGSIDTKFSTANTALAAIQAAGESTATVNVAHDSNAMKLGATSATPKFAKIAASTSGNNTVVAAVTSKKIRVLAYNLMGAGAVNAKFQDGAGGTDLTGLKYIAAAGGGICAPFNPVGWFETTAGTLLNLNLSGAIAVGGEVVYIEV